VHAQLVSGYAPRRARRRQRDAVPRGVVEARSKCPPWGCPFLCLSLGGIVDGEENWRYHMARWDPRTQDCRLAPRALTPGRLRSQTWAASVRGAQDHASRRSCTRRRRGVSSAFARRPSAQCARTQPTRDPSAPPAPPLAPSPATISKGAKVTRHCSASAFCRAARPRAAL